MENINELFGRINDNGNIDVLHADGYPATRVEADNLYPIGSDLGSRYEHAEGIEITREDAERIGLEIEH